MFRPLDDRVIVEAESVKNTTESGLIIPEEILGNTRYGKVVSVGTDKELQELVKVGDVVFYDKAMGTPLTDSRTGRQYVLLYRRDVQGFQED